MAGILNSVFITFCGGNNLPYILYLRIQNVEPQITTKDQYIGNCLPEIRYFMLRERFTLKPLHIDGIFYSKIITLKVYSDIFYP